MSVRLLIGHVLDKLAELEAESVHCCVTSPPYYGLRDYGIEPQVWPDGWRGSLGLEPTPALYIEHMIAVFRAVRRVLRKDGTLWLNIGDSYVSSPTGSLGTKLDERIGRGTVNASLARPSKLIAGFKPKDLLGIPWMLAFALRDDGWYLRSEITWAKRAPMPESVTDRPTSATEKVFLLSRSPRYFYDAEAVKEEASENSVWTNHPQPDKAARAGITRNGTGKSTLRVEANGKRNMRNWWLLGPEPFPEAHFATFPSEIPRRAISAGSKPGDTILDPFAGAGTTLLVADQLQRHGIGIELNPAYADLATTRIHGDCPLFVEVIAARLPEGRA